MRNLLAAATVAIMLISPPAIASAQSTGSLGSTGAGQVAPPTESYPPNQLELQTIAVYHDAAPALAREIGAYSTDSHDFRRDPELSEKAQWAAERTIKFVLDQQSQADEGEGARYTIDPGLLVDIRAHRDTILCGPAPLTIDEIHEAYVESRDNFVGENRIIRRGSVGTFNDPLVGVGYAEGGGIACSYGLMKPSNFPFF